MISNPDISIPWVDIRGADYSRIDLHFPVSSVTNNLLSHDVNFIIITFWMQNAYRQTIDKVKQYEKEIAILVASYRTEVQAKIATGITYKWDYFVNTCDPHYRLLTLWNQEIGTSFSSKSR